MCVHTADGGSRGKPDGCGTSFCSPERGREDSWCDGLPHRAEDLENMMRGHEKRGGSYNEVIVDTRALQDHLPSSVEALFYVAGSSMATEAFVRQAYDKFTRRYGLEAEAFPLLVLDPSSPSAPFAVAASVRLGAE